MPLTNLVVVYNFLPASTQEHPVSIESKVLDDPYFQKLVGRFSHDLDCNSTRKWLCQLMDNSVWNSL